MSLADINFVSNTVILALVLISMGLRMKGNYLWHGVTMIVAVGYTLVVFFGLGLPNLLDSNYNPVLMSPTLHLAVFGLHAFFGLSTLVSGIWLVALWRPHSTEFPAKSKKIAQSTTILWVLAYIVGALLFVTLNTTILT